ncbi:hypothetical protein [uncultured Methanospirillum sp.]|uniref:hypothetical protein n=1 Tax=uncultured Methanospirillum sp. TaxID=262503 RepID=UPI0029C78E70|nr:hypothetical protein [uncultured Methanospirillum sp.]
MNTDVPCCQADALRRVRQVPVNGIPTGITMLDEIIAEVKAMNLSSDQLVKDAVLKKVKVYNYVPKAAEDAYLKAILAEYHKSGSS